MKDLKKNVVYNSSLNCRHIFKICIISVFFLIKTTKIIEIATANHGRLYPEIACPEGIDEVDVSLIMETNLELVCFLELFT